MTEESLAGRISSTLLRVMMIVVWGVWAPIGFLLWIPLLVRATIVFAAFVVHAAITGQDPTHLRQHLEAAIDFWFAGFRFARETVQPQSSSVRRPFESQTSRVLIEILWAIAFWVALTLLIHPETIVGLIPELPSTGEAEPQEMMAIVGLAGIIAFIVGVAVGNANKDTRQAGRK